MNIQDLVAYLGGLEDDADPEHDLELLLVAWLEDLWEEGRPAYVTKAQRLSEQHRKAHPEVTPGRLALGFGPARGRARQAQTHTVLALEPLGPGFWEEVRGALEDEDVHDPDDPFVLLVAAEDLRQEEDASLLPSIDQGLEVECTCRETVTPCTHAMALAELAAGAFLAKPQLMLRWLGHEGQVPKRAKAKGRPRPAPDPTPAPTPTRRRAQPALLIPSLLPEELAPGKAPRRRAKDPSEPFFQAGAATWAALEEAPGGPGPADAVLDQAPPLPDSLGGAPLRAALRVLYEAMVAPSEDEEDPA